MEFPYKRALVTGGAGFIGSHIVEELLTFGVKVVCVDNFLAGKVENINPFLKNKNFIMKRVDITDYNKLKPCFKDVDVVFHNAASKKTVCMKDPRLDLKINGGGTFNLLELSRASDVKKFVHASTGSVYGEPQYSPQDENHPLKPVSYYGVSKLAGERYIDVFHHLYGMNTTILRYFHVYGPRQDSSDYGGVVSIFVKRLLNDQPPIIHGDGTQQRSFTYVKDVVKANILVSNHKKTNGEVYNCASGAKITIQQLADLLRKHMNRENIKETYDDWAPGDIKVFDVSSQKLQALGMKFETSFDDGLKETIKSEDDIRKGYIS